MQLAGVSTLDAPTDETIAAEVENHLRAVLRRERDRWAAIDPWFAEPVDLVTRSTLAGGKRLRPLFCRYGFLAAGGDPNDRSWLDLAAGIELLHSFALIHDDVMDGSARRRGQPALHRALDETHRRAGWRGEARRFGEGVSVLVGDLAFACADRLVRAAGADVGAVWDELRTELMMGQYLDVVGACRGALPIERALLVARYKSGAYTVERPLHLGAVLAGADADLVEAFSAFGRPLGEAFQLRDDLLGVFGDEATTGKPVGEDLREGKPTVLLALARDLVGPQHARLLATVGTPDLDDGDVARLRTLLVDCGARDAVEQLIADRHAHALAALDGAAVPEAIGARLRSLAGTRRVAGGVMDVVVVGAGLSGLSTACHLAGRGHDVTVVEHDAMPGGRAGRLERDGYRFDTGPTVLTMPSLLEQTFAAAGADMAEMLTLHPIDPMYRANFADGSVIHVRNGREAMTEEIRTTCGPRQAAAFDRFVRWLTALYEVEMPHFIDRNFDSPFDLARPMGPALRLLRLGGLRRLATKVDGFFDDDRLRRLFSFQAMYAGLAPYEALAAFGVITYMDSVGGVYFPEGGMHAVPSALAAAATKAGAVIRYETTVEQIVLARGSSGPVQGVRLAGGELLSADAVVCSPDLPVAYRTLLPGLPAPRRAAHGRFSPSTLLLHLGVGGELPAGTAHHNIHFGGEWDRAFQALIDDGRRMADPSFLVTVPTLGDPSMAPAGRHVLFALEPVPNLDGMIDWTRERERARSELLGRLDAAGYPVDADVEVVVDPTDWEHDGMERGTPFALAHRFFQTGPFRPGNVHDRAPGLVFAGSGTVPGVGVPMVLLSGRLAAERVEARR